MLPRVAEEPLAVEDIFSREVFHLMASGHIVPLPPHEHVADIVAA